MPEKNDDLRELIQTALRSFESRALRDASLGLLETLGYTSDKTIPIPESDPAAFLDLVSEHNPEVTINKHKALFDDWIKADMLFQLTDEELSREASLFKNDLVNPGLLQSYLFFAIELNQRDYARGRLTAIARQLNRIFPMPVMVFIKHRDLLSIAVINRRANRRDAEKDVLGKVTIIRDISLANPHRGHLDILKSFALSSLLAKTAIHNFDTLHAAWEEIFNVELLNKRFYKELANWYFWALPAVRFPDDMKPPGLTEAQQADYYEKLRATGLIRLLTRLIFCWFLKEKGLIPETLFDPKQMRQTLSTLHDDSSSYYLAILQNLFFATLNQRMGKDNKGKPYRRFITEHTYQGKNHEHGVTTLYRHKKLFKDPDTATDLFCEVPFLNGGLFECLDVEDEQNKNLMIRVDGFSEKEKSQPSIPNRFFFREGEVDIGAVTGEKNRGTEKAKGLIQILSAYKFTIIENTPIDQEIALDPELLGKVFENLLASYNEETRTTARKQTGSFYTPRPIVDYMVDESLKAHLTTVLMNEHNMAEEDARTGLDILFAYTEKQHAFKDNEVDTLIKGIDSCKILDPACGSGAFPMGVLHKLVYILDKLDPDNARWKQTQLDKLDSVSMREELERTFGDNNDDYGRKLYLIENCLYGVDIQPIAIQLSKLRFFISLICDQKTNRNKQQNHGVRPLPNLETKFVAADTLISLDNATHVGLAENTNGDLFENPEIERIEQALQRVRHDHFAVQTRQKKLALQNKDKQLREQLAQELMHSTGADQVTSRNLAQWDPYDTRQAAAFFEPVWMFDRSIADGFDLVIGNPPYLRIQGIRQTDPEKADFYKNHYRAATGSFDLYVIFIERGMQFLKKQGILNYINPDKWVNASFGKGIRAYAVENQNVHQLISFGAHQVFSACTYSSLLWMGKEPSASIRYNRIDPPENRTVSLSDELANIRFARIPYAQLSPDPWVLTSGEKSVVMSEILAFPSRLGSIFSKIFQGIASSRDSVYFLRDAEVHGKYVVAHSPELNERISIEKGLVKPLLLGDQVHRFEKLCTNNLVVFPYNLPSDTGGKAVLMTAAQIARDYPKGWEYLKRCEAVLRGRERGRFDNPEWYQFGRKQGIDNGNFEKLIAPDISLGGNFSIDYGGEFYTTTTLYGYLKKEGVWESYEYWLALLNSSVLWFYLKNSGSVLANGYFRYKPAYLENFPLPSPDERQERVISNLGKLALHASSVANGEEKKALRAFLDDVIDACVFELYFPEHMAERGLSILLLVERLLSSFDPSASELDKKDILTNFHKTANAPDHAIRNRLLRLTADSPNLLAVIKEKGAA